MTVFWREDIAVDHEPHKVLIIRDTLVDVARGARPVALKVYYPVNHHLKHLPVIFWSHGLGGGVDGAGFLSRFVASYGYIVVHLQHKGTDTSLWEGQKGHPWDIIRKANIPRQATLDRFADVPFVLNALPAWMAGHPDLACHVDLDNVAMSGHSFGAMTTQVICGMVFPDEKGVLRSYKDPRFKCGLPYSMVPIQHLALDDPNDIYGAIDRPMFFMTGTDDDSPIEGWGYDKRLVVHQYCGHPDKHLLVIKHGDHMVFNGSRGKLGASPHRDTHEGIIKILSLSYWDMMMKGDAAAKDWLTGGGAAAWLGDGARLS